MKHKSKVKMARKMSLTKEEQKKQKDKKIKIPIFQTEQWELRKQAKLKKQQEQGKKFSK